MTVHAYSDIEFCFRHIHGHHKFIQWSFVIHDAINGYSRMTVYLHCSDNKRAYTELNFLRSLWRKMGLHREYDTIWGLKVWTSHDLCCIIVD